jgi:hypothetical protein
MEWISKNRYIVLGYLIFLVPPLLIPAFVHNEELMKRWVYFVEIFCTPLATIVGNLGKKRRAMYVAGIATFLVPIEMMWIMGYRATISPPTKEQIAAWYLPTFFFLVIGAMIVGFWLTYVGSRESDGNGKPVT